MPELPLREHVDVMREHLTLRGARIIDVGCGGGGLVRHLTREGARVSGIECSEEQLNRARAAERVGDEDYLFGYGEDLPLPDASVDIAVYSNSLHHVPVENQLDALRETARVLRSGGLLYVQEPLAEGSAFELVRPVDDETEVRARAREAIARAAREPGLEERLEYRYLTRVRFADFEDFREDVILVDSRRLARFEDRADAMREAFACLGERRADGWYFDQPTRVNVIAKR